MQHVALVSLESLLYITDLAVLDESKDDHTEPARVFAHAGSAAQCSLWTLMLCSLFQNSEFTATSISHLPTDMIDVFGILHPDGSDHALAEQSYQGRFCMDVECSVRRGYQVPFSFGCSISALLVPI